LYDILETFLDRDISDDIAVVKRDMKKNCELTIMTL